MRISDRIINGIKATALTFCVYLAMALTALYFKVGTSTSIAIYSTEYLVSQGTNFSFVVLEPMTMGVLILVSILIVYIIMLKGINDEIK